jgi:hypothetical protein
MNEMLDSRYDDINSGRVKPFRAMKSQLACVTKVPPAVRSIHDWVRVS